MDLTCMVAERFISFQTGTRLVPVFFHTLKQNPTQESKLLVFKLERTSPWWY